MVKKVSHGWAVWATMFVLLMGGITTAYWSESRGNPIHAERGVDVAASETQSGGNMEGKEVRYGIANSVIWGVSTTAASNGSVNSMHDSWTPIAGLVPLVNMQLGEVVFGGVGAGLYGMLMYVILTVFIAGLMVGRTPEYLGKKIGAREVQMAMLYVLIAAASILIFTAISSVMPQGLAGRNNAGPHGLSEILYAFSSTTGNNGSAFAGLTGGTYWYNTQLGFATLIGRFALIVPMLALAGFMAERRVAPESAGTFPVNTPLFAVLLGSVVLIIGALTFFPVLSLGPIVEHLLMLGGRLF
jgi:K+-transporting ATPase ATPase A chain